MRKYNNSNLSYKDSKSLEIPKFQRELVWSKSEKLALIRTIHNGFPFGSLLVSEETTDKGTKLLLLDGQQRLSTIQDYSKKRFQYWKNLEEDKYNALKKNINNLIDKEENHVDDKKLEEITKEG